MAEVLLKVKPGSNYDDGDVLCAFNRRRIRCVHAQHICHPWKAPANGDGLLPLDGLAEWYLLLTSKYRFERVSTHEIRRINLLTGESIVYGSTPIEDPDRPGTKIHCHVDEFFRRRLKVTAPNGTPKGPTFGTLGHEVMYEGSHDFSDAKLDQVWAKITEKTGLVEEGDELALWPFGRLDIRAFLAVRVAEFTDEEAEQLVRPQHELGMDRKPVLYDDAGNVSPDGNPKIVAKRNVKIDWRKDLLDDLQVTEAQVLDVQYPVGKTFVGREGRVCYRSKDQPIQSDMRKLFSKEIGGPTQWKRNIIGT